MVMKLRRLSGESVAHQMAEARVLPLQVKEGKYKRWHVLTTKQDMMHPAFSWLKPTGPLPKLEMLQNYQRYHVFGLDLMVVTISQSVQ